MITYPTTSSTLHREFSRNGPKPCADPRTVIPVPLTYSPYASPHGIPFNQEMAERQLSFRSAMSLAW